MVVVQADEYNRRLRHAVVAQVKSNLNDKDDPACLFIDVRIPEGKATGLDQECMVCCYMLSLMGEDRLENVIGKLSDEMLVKVDECLKTAMGIR